MNKIVVKNCKIISIDDKIVTTEQEAELKVEQEKADAKEELINIIFKFINRKSVNTFQFKI